jgi:hypothetical protein
MKKIYTFRGQTGKKKGPQSPKTEFEAQNQYFRVIYPSIENFTWSKKNILLGVKKVEISLLSPKTEFGAQNQYDRVQGRTGHITRWEKSHGAPKAIGAPMMLEKNSTKFGEPIRP